MNAVIVEDDALVGDAVRRALERVGFDVEHLCTGRAGLEVLTMRPFDLAIIDIDLPDMDGVELVQELRRRGQSLPAIVLSARDVATQRPRALASGASDYLAKPFHVDALIARCRAQVGHSAPQTQDLSPSHRCILERLSREFGHIVSSEILAQAAHCGPGELAAQMAELRTKLKFPTRIRQVRGLGYRID